MHNIEQGNYPRKVHSLTHMQLSLLYMTNIN